MTTTQVTAGELKLGNVVVGGDGMEYLITATRETAATIFVTVECVENEMLMVKVRPTTLRLSKRSLVTLVS